MQNIKNTFLNEIIFGSEDECIPFKKKGPGTGHSKHGCRKKWKKKLYFEQDLLSLFQKNLNETTFKARFAGYTPLEIEKFFETIKLKAIKSRESFWHSRNKLLLWLDKLHNCLSLHEISEKYCIGTATGVRYVEDVLKAIIHSYKNKNVITFPPKNQRIEMVKILKKKKVSMPDAIFSLDGSHLRCTGRHITERLSHKYHWLPCFNALFVIERVFGTVCAVNLDPQARKHDVTVLREAWFYNNIEEIMGEWIILADKGYQGVQHETSSMAVVLKRNQKNRNKYSKRFWKEINSARADSERIFSHFFYNKFTQLGNWKGKSKQTFEDWALNVICCVILYNVLKI